MDWQRWQRFERGVALVVSATFACAAGWVLVGTHGSARAAGTAAQDHAALHALPQLANGVGPAPEVFAAIAPVSAPTKLYVPPVLTPRVENGTKVFSLRAQAGTITRFGETLSTAGFNGGYLAPTIRIGQRERIRIDVDNQLAEPTTVHWHGLHVAAMFDGGPYQPIAPGGTWHPTFTVAQQATTLWYHPHLMGQTAAQVGRGMAGMLIVDDTSSAVQRALPHRYGVDDLPLLLQGAPLPLDGGDGERRPLLVNGTPNAVHRTTAGRVRLRVVNGTGGAMLGVSVRGARSVRQVGSDGGLLPAPAAGTNVVLGPSERAELVVEFARPGQRIAVRSTILEDRGPAATREQAAFLRGTSDPVDSGTVLTLVNTAKVLRAQRALPKRLNTAPALDVSRAVQRTMTLGPNIEINGVRMGDRDHQMGADWPSTIRIPLGQTEVWTLNNTSPFTHTFHVHDIEFRVLDRDGRAPSAAERGWKDSIHVPPSGTVRIAMQFTDFADPDNPYMFHCHVLRHEDAGMMGQFVVERGVDG